ncbi:MAG: hydroxyacid dehydrogenase [Anaerotruncus sp.]|nr:hydroxyacid dehydrogenase [Anaerotruncus sp.]
MKLVILEPLGIDKAKLFGMLERKLSKQVETVYYDTRVEDVPTLIERSKDADIVVLSNFQYRKEVIEHCPQLKMICVAFTGVDHVDVDYCKERGITVCNCAGYSTVAVADLVFGLVIGLYRRIVACNTVTRESGTKNGLVGFELAGKKFGVIGTGAIGCRVAAIAQAFGCEVFAYSRTKKELPGVTYTDLDTLLGCCDIVSLHVPATAQTKGLINAEKLALMKPSAILINTARGPVVDSAALAQALNEGKLAGAGIDVFEGEPPIAQDHPLLHAANTIVTPHVAFATAESMEKRAVIVFENIERWLAGKPQNVIC